MIALLEQSTLALDRTMWSVPVGVASFKEFKWEIDDSASLTVYFSTFVMQYCKATGEVCEAIGDFPAVSDGQISPSSCPEGFRGYSYRVCNGGIFSEVKEDKCVYKVPAKLEYAKSIYTFIQDTQVETDIPRYVNVITEFFLQENTHLPGGLQLDPKTGKIYGKPTTVTDEMIPVTVYGKNPVGTTMAIFNIQVRKGECAAEGVFPKAEVGTVATYECSSDGNYIGTRTRPCVLGKVNGEWGKASGFCMSVATIVIIVIVAIAVIAVLALLIIRNKKRVKAVGGVKSKSVKASAKASSKGSQKLEKKSVKKDVKV